MSQDLKSALYAPFSSFYQFAFNNVEKVIAIIQQMSPWIDEITKALGNDIEEEV
jgi:hypothetical protein